MYLCLRLFPGGSFGRKHSFVRYLKIPNDKNKKSCDQNDETFWSRDLTKIEITFEISCGDVDSLVIFVIFYALLSKKFKKNQCCDCCHGSHDASKVSLRSVLK